MRTNVDIDPARLDWEKTAGLIPAIVQDDSTGSILMQGYMDIDAVRKTIETGRVTFYSRSRKSLWTKGETSGNYLILKGMWSDCDQDSILVRATPTGPTCHLGEKSCFGEEGLFDNTGMLEQLEQVVAERMISNDESSYTRELVNAGIKRIAQKVGEEAVEVVIAATDQDDQAFLDETADLLYHLTVLVRGKGLLLSHVEQVLIDRRKQ
ncbi:MAG: bifunctional phosphoribosyl-AMP cyclohydrolase/phosphoribosyl-ATP diphosphatase HisIE [Rhodothermales bacterium]|nr:bifunctional phosphoribosyl-AMP cyclohydrolase/phosphoribosyl-ATP diphosphatase HisIE [Rhodothermales bacterium]